jgi:hypothetical protein
VETAAPLLLETELEPIEPEPAPEPPPLETSTRPPWRPRYRRPLGGTEWLSEESRERVDWINKQF